MCDRSAAAQLTELSRWSMASNKPLQQRSIQFYLRNPATTSISESESESERRSSPIVINIKERKKRPVGRPRKTKPGQQSTAVKLVDYSSSEDENVSVQEPKAKQLRKMYSAVQKKNVADYSRHHGVRKAARRFKVSHSNVVRWKKQVVAKLKNPNKRRNKRGQGRKLSYPKELEEKLVVWILEKREAECVPISTQVIRCKALSLIHSVNPTFKASDGWVRKFMKRNNLVLRARTHISQSLPKDLEQKITAFRAEVASIFDSGDYPLDFICNMDETPVFLDLLPNKVVDKRGKKSINVRTTASEKNRITATLCCSASGKMLPPFVVFKGKTKRGLKKVTVPKGVVCTTQTKAWMDEKRMLEWIEQIWLPYVGKNKALLSLDTFSGHLTDAVKDMFAKIGTKLLVIPGGCTSILQPLDVSINKPFKSYIRQCWCERMISEAESGVAKITPASKDILMGWIKTAADRIEQAVPIIEKSFQVTGIVKKPDCTRSDALYKEIQEVMIDIFGPDHMGYVEPTEDPFADIDSDSSCEPQDVDTMESTEDPFADSDSSCDVDADTTEDPVAESDGPETDYSGLEYSDISGEFANDSN